jgi:hypothetical protein
MSTEDGQSLKMRVRITALFGIGLTAALSGARAARAMRTTAAPARTL